MHSYSVDRELRRNFAIVIFILSMFISLLLKQYLTGILNAISSYLMASEINSLFELVKWFELNPNILGVPFWYVVLSWAFEHYAWKWGWLRKVHKIPNLNGKWKGTLKSSFDEKVIPMEMDIEQTWSKISFKSYFPEKDSRSFSNVAAIYVDSNNGTEISFAFRNNSYDVESNLQSYDGYNILQLIDDKKIKAKYFNDRQNPDPKCKGGNKGSFELEREHKSK